MGEKGAKTSMSKLQVLDDVTPGGCDTGDEQEAGQISDNWIPNQAYNLAHSFRIKHGDELSIELVNEMLRDLNNIYRDREKRQMARVKLQSQEQINKLKRKLSYRPTYDEIAAKKNKSTLKR